MTHTHTYTHTHTQNNRLWSPLAYGLGGNNRLWSPLAYGLGGKKIASRKGAPRSPMTDVGTETAFRLDQRKHFRKINIP